MEEKIFYLCDFVHRYTGKLIVDAFFIESIFSFSSSIVNEDKVSITY